MTQTEDIASHKSEKFVEDTQMDDCTDTSSDVEMQTTPEATAEPDYSIFSTRQKSFYVAMATVAAMFSPLTATIYYPALNQLATDFHTTAEIVNVTIITYMIFQGLAPTFVGNFADHVGRRPAYIACFVIYIAACIGCALTPNFVGLLILRMLQSSGSSGTMSLASGVASDLSVGHERGKYMGWAISGSMFGPAIGPIIGGVLAEKSGWRSIFWFLAALGGFTIVVIFIFYPETCRNIVGNGSIKPQPWNLNAIDLTKRIVIKKELAAPKEDQIAAATIAKKKFRFPNPFGTFKVLGEKDAAMVLWYNSINFAAYYQIQASLPTIFAPIYHYNDLQIGLCFIPFGVGCLVAPVVTGVIMDWNYRRVAKSVGIDCVKGKNTVGNMPLERARIPVLWPLTVATVIATICYGWLVDARVHVAGPLVFTFILGFAFTATFNISSVLLVDYYPQEPSTATAAVNLCRCLLGAGAVAAIVPMLKAMGNGWCFTFIGLVLLLSAPCLSILSRWGPGWREARAQRLLAAKEAKAQEKS